MSALTNWAQYSPVDEFWTVAIVVILACLGGFTGAFWFLIRKRVLEDIPTSKIRSAAQGYLELNGFGHLMEGPQIIAPLSGTPATWYSFKVEEYRNAGKRSSWVTIEKATSDGLFLLVDDTGKCIIDPEGADVIPTVSESWYGTARRPQSGPKLSRGRWAGGRFRYTEKRMHAGDKLHAIGLYKTVGGASTEFNINAEVVMLLKRWKADSQSMLLKYDDNKDGQIDVHEWETVRNGALQHVVGQHRDYKHIPSVNVLCKTQDPRRPFILSALPQGHLIKRYSRYSAGLIAVFFLSGTFAIWILGLRFYGV